MSRGSVGEPVPALPQPTDEPAADAATRRGADRASRAANDGDGARAARRAARRQRRRATLIATPSTRQSGLAEYLDGWRRRVERIGTANYPTQLLGDIDAGRPTLEVVIAADGRLDDIVVRRSSGDKALDQAALRILRLAAPFAPLPPTHPRRLRRAAVRVRMGLRRPGADADGR